MALNTINDIKYCQCYMTIMATGKEALVLYWYLFLTNFP